MVVNESEVKGSKPVFNLGSIQFVYGGDERARFYQELLHMQAKAMNEILFEKLKGNASVEMAISKIPKELCVMHFNDEMSWSLVH